jgi:C4-dicarboxylate transporter DctM subunit
LIGALPFMLCILVGIGLLILFPQIALWLPNLLMGPAQ